MPKMEYISVGADDCATVEDVMQLILRLPYRAACQFAEAIDGDVDKIVEGATEWLDAEEAGAQAND